MESSSSSLFWLWITLGLLFGLAVFGGFGVLSVPMFLLLG